MNDDFERMIGTVLISYVRKRRPEFMHLNAMHALARFARDPVLASLIGEVFASGTVITEHCGVTVMHLQPIEVLDALSADTLLVHAAGRVRGENETQIHQRLARELVVLAPKTFHPVLLQYGVSSVLDEDVMRHAVHLGLSSATVQQTCLVLGAYAEFPHPIAATGPDDSPTVFGEASVPHVLLRKDGVLGLESRDGEWASDTYFLFINNNPDGVLAGS